jgi:hypothetical protein
MDRRKSHLMATLGLGFLAASTGCQSFMHRATVPPAPKSPREGGQAQFNSAPHPAPAAMNGRPTGPIANTASPYGSSGLYGPGRGGNEAGNMPTGDAGATPPNASANGAPGDAPPAF